MNDHHRCRTIHLALGLGRARRPRPSVEEGLRRKPRSIYRFPKTQMNLLPRCRSLAEINDLTNGESRPVPCACVRNLKFVNVSTVHLTFSRSQSSTLMITHWERICVSDKLVPAACLCSVAFWLKTLKWSLMRCTYIN